jgi:hypothetical protein
MAICCLTNEAALVNSRARACRKPVAERKLDGECASNDTFRNFIETFSIGVHRRLNPFLPVV